MAKDNKEQTKKPWISYEINEYQEAIGGMVHQSFKTVNTNIGKGGVRLSKEWAVKIPYVGIRSLLSINGNQHIPMDRIAGANEAAIYGQIQSADRDEKIEGAPDEEVSLIRSLLEKTRQTSAVFCDGLSPRIRQILIPKPDGTYISISPISSGSVASKIMGEIISHNKKFYESIKSDQNDHKIRLITQSNNPIGGSKPQNIGQIVNALRNPICVDVPSADISLRKALSLFYKGIRDLSLPAKISQEYVEWRNGISGQYHLNTETRLHHERFIKLFINHYLNLGKEVHEILLDNIEHLPNNEIISPTIRSHLQLGIILSKERTNDWKYEFSSFIARKIINLETDEKRRYEYTQNEINAITTIARSHLN